MRNGWTALAAVLLLAGVAVSARAQPSTVDVQLGPAVQSRSDELGRDELEEQAAYLRRDVQAALAHSAAPTATVRLVIADIEPNRPTSAQLGTSPQLRQGSFGTGGAAVTGEVVTPDGRSRPVRYRFFQDQIRDEANFTTWGDADQAFDDLAAQLSKGRAPDDPRAWPPPHRARAVTGTRIPG